jgi:hypothetical protein
MPIDIDERPESRAWSGGACTYLYRIIGSDDYEAVMDAVTAERPVNVTNPANDQVLLPADPNLDPQHIEADATKCLWYASVQYAAAPAGELLVTGESELSFDTSGQTVHVTQSLSTVSTTAASGAVSALYNGAIGFNGTDASGCDIVVPQFNFTVVKTKLLGDVNTAYIGSLYALTGKVNSAEWSVTVNGATLTFAAGEALFLGASGTVRRGAGDWQFQYRFAASPNIASGGLPAIGAITFPAKKGWEYVWVRYVPDSSGSNMILKPLHAVVEKVYQEGNFALLAL